MKGKQKNKLVVLIDDIFYCISYFSILVAAFFLLYSAFVFWAYLALQYANDIEMLERISMIFVAGQYITYGLTIALIYHTIKELKK